MKTPLLSVVIPCYNHGQFLQEAIDSVESYQGDAEVEMIIVNDGSTDYLTLEVLQNLQNKGYHVINQPNLGLANARNNGIRLASGKYILPLDSDNKIIPSFIDQSLKILKSEEADIVYGKPLFFGETKDRIIWEVSEFSIDRLLLANYIDACALFRKDVWIRTGGYDAKMPFCGLEDWDFWLSAYERNFKFYFINEPAFHYRMVADSMISNSTNEKDYHTLNQYVFKKHFSLYYMDWKRLQKKESMYQNDVDRPFRSFFKFLYNKVKRL